VLDLKDEQVAWDLKLDKGVRPMTLESAPTARPAGFRPAVGAERVCVVDFAQRKGGARIRFRIKPNGYGKAEDAPIHPPMA